MDGKKTYRSWNDIDSGEEIVISGIAGRFPGSNDMNQLQENLFNKIDLVRADHGRWEKGENSNYSYTLYSHIFTSIFTYIYVRLFEIE